MAFAENVEDNLSLQVCWRVGYLRIRGKLCFFYKKRKQSKAGFAWMAQWASGLEVGTKTSLILCCRYEHVNTVQL